MNEIEVKIIDIDVEDIKHRLEKLAAEKVKDEIQVNNLYDFPDRRLLGANGYARIRVVEDKLTNTTHNYMTVKKMLSQEKYKVMDEQEIEIDDAVTGKKILESLGLTLVKSIKKTRESYKVSNTLVEIDINDKSFCPFPYIELESDHEGDLVKVIELLGYKLSDVTSKTIFEILKEKGL